MLDAVKFLRRIAAQPSLAEVIAEEVLPGPQCRQRRRADRRFPPAQRHRLSSGRHLPHGARPGSVGGRSAPSVHGIAGLRVIDASIFPVNISGNTNAAAIVTGAKGADMVLEDQK